MGLTLSCYNPDEEDVDCDSSDYEFKLIEEVEVERLNREKSLLADEKAALEKAREELARQRLALEVDKQAIEAQRDSGSGSMRASAAAATSSNSEPERRAIDTPTGSSELYGQANGGSLYNSGSGGGSGRAQQVMPSSSTPGAQSSNGSGSVTSPRAQLYYVRYKDESRDVYYFHNAGTGECRWDLPAGQQAWCPETQQYIAGPTGWIGNSSDLPAGSILRNNEDVNDIDLDKEFAAMLRDKGHKKGHDSRPQRRTQSMMHYRPGKGSGRVGSKNGFDIERASAISMLQEDAETDDMFDDEYNHNTTNSTLSSRNITRNRNFNGGAPLRLDILGTSADFSEYEGGTALLTPERTGRYNDQMTPAKSPTLQKELEDVLAKRNKRMQMKQRAEREMHFRRKTVGA